MITQLLLEQTRLMIAAIENGVVAIAATILETMTGDFHGHQLGFLLGRRRRNNADCIPESVIGPELFLEQFFVVGDQGVCRIQNAIRRAIVLLQFYDIQFRKVHLQRAQVLHVGAAPGVNGLVVVAHRGESATHTGELPQQLVLRAVGVLVFVDEQVTQTILPALQRFGVFLEKPHR